MSRRNGPIAAGALEDFFNHQFCPTDTSAMGLEIFPPDLASDSAGFEVFECPGDLEAEFIDVPDTEPRSPHFENLDDLSCILEMRPEENRTSGVHGFDKVVPPDRDQRPAYERDRSRGIRRR